TAAQSQADEIDGRRSKRGTLRAVSPAAMLTSARSVPCACARVNINRRVSFPTSTYHPILNPCSVSRAPPRDKNTRSDHQPKRKFRWAFFLMVWARGAERIIRQGGFAYCRARFEGVGKCLVANVHLNRAASQ